MLLKSCHEQQTLSVSSLDMSGAGMGDATQQPPAKRQATAAGGVTALVPAQHHSQQTVWHAEKRSILKELPKELLEFIVSNPINQIRIKHLSRLNRTSNWMKSVSRGSMAWQDQFNLARCSPWKATDPYFLRLLGVVGLRIQTFTLPMGFTLQPHALDSILVKLPFLKKFKCWDCKSSKPARSTNQHDVGLWDVLAERCPQLREVYIGSSNGFCDLSLCKLATTCEFMHTLVIPGAKITDEGIRCLAAHNKKLVRLELFQSRNLNDDAVAELITSCSQMRYLDLAENPGLGRETAAAIAASCPKLEHLDLSSTDVGDLGLCKILAQCPALVSLGLMSCFNVSDVSVDAMRLHSPALNALELTGCVLVTAAGLTRLVKAKIFKVLLMGGLSLENEPGPAVTDQVVSDLVQVSGPTLRILGLNDIPTITDAAIDAIAQGCSMLPWLDIDGCDLVTKCDLEDACETANEVDPLWHFSNMAIFVRSYMPRWLNCQQMLLPQVLDLPWHAERRIMRDAAVVLQNSGVDHVVGETVAAGTTVVHIPIQGDEETDGNQTTTD